MNKKIVVLAVLCTILILLGGIQTTILYSTQYLSSKPGYSFTISSGLDWWDCNWSYCKKITIDHTKLQATQADYPVLLYRSSDAELAAYAQDDGDDITFVDVYNTTQYKHEIEKFNGNTGELVAWVKIPSVSHTQDTILYMYYGNPSCGSQENITATWESNFKMVQHLNESAGVIFDSTANSNDGTNNGAIYNASSKIDGGYDFDGDSSNNINCGTNTSLNITNQITLEGWVKDPPLTKKANVRILDKHDEQRSLIAGKIFTVKRTINSDIPTNVVFVALSSPGVKLNDMIFGDGSVFAGLYQAGGPQSEEERRIEDIRLMLSEELKNLGEIAYSKPFEIKENTTIQMMFEPEKQYNLFSTGRISYLVISNDGSYDFEGTTHWSYSPGLIGLFNRFSFFKNYYDFPFSQSSDKTSSTAISEGEPYKITYFKAPENSFGFGEGYTKEINWSYFWNFIDMHAAWGLQQSSDGNKWSWINESLVETKHRSEDNTFEKSTLNFTVYKNWYYRLVYKINQALQSYYNDSANYRYLLNFSVGTNETYNTLFNWNDLKDLKGFTIIPSVQNNYFKFIVRRTERIPASMDGKIITIDPTFGDTTQYTAAYQSIEGTIRGINGTAAGGSGNADNITVALRKTDATGTTWTVKCALYDSSGNYIATTQERTITPTTTMTWYVFNFSSPKPLILNGNTYKIYVWANDAAGVINVGNATSGAPGRQYRTLAYAASWPNPIGSLTYVAGSYSIYCSYTVDSTAPTSSVNAISPYWKKTSPLTITGTASDTGTSGLKNVTLWYRYRATNASSWGGWTNSRLVDTDSWVSVSWSFTFPNGTGHYQFYSIARDNATNTETYTGGADGQAKCGYDNQKPSSFLTAITPYWQKTSPLAIFATASDTGPSGLKNATLWYRFTTDNSTWWNPGWMYRKQLNINNKNGGYQMKIIVGNTSGGNVTCNGHARSNFGDIRFVSYSTNTTQLSYWLKNYTANTQATFWINNSLNDTSIWMYYGNSSASTTSNGTNTFHFFDDFSNGLSKWVMDSWNTDSIFVNASQGNPAPALKHLPDNSIPANRTYQDTRIRTKDYKILDGVIEYDVYLAGTPRIIHQFGWRVNGLSWTNGYCWRLQTSGADGGFLRFTAPAAWTLIGTTFPDAPAATWYHVKVDVSGANYVALVNPACGGATTRSVTDSTKLTADYLVSHVHGVSMGATNYLLVDNIFVRKYRATPPSWSSFGNEIKGWTKFGVVTDPWVTPIKWNFNFPNLTGYYQFYSIAVDNATNTELGPSTPDTNCGYDTAAPTSSVNAISPYWKKSSPLTITVTASDTGYSGLKNVTLYYYNSTNNNTWRGPWKFGSTNSTPWITPIRWNFNFTNGTGYYRFYSRAYDNATNQETFTGNDTWCGYDITAPSSNVNAITPYWRKAAATITATATDATSGVKNVTLWYRFSTDNNSWGGWVSSTTDTALPWSWSFTFSNGSGYYQFYSIARDNATNAESAPGGNGDANCGYDTAAPTSSVNAISPYWKKSSPLTITVTASDTGPSGLKNVTLYYYNSTNNVTWRGPWKFGSTNSTPWVTPIRWNFNFTNGTGYYRFYSRAADNATNMEAAPAVNDTKCGYDTAAPTSSVNAISPYWKKSSPTAITATASDALSGVKNVTLYYRFSNDNNSWGGWVSAGVDTALPWSWSFAFSNGSGYYQFYSIATDNATNAETPTGSADASCGYDNQAPSSNVDAIAAPYWKMSSPLTINGTASDTGPSGLKNVTLWYRFRSSNASSWGGWVSSGLVDTDPWVAVSWSFEFSNGTGHYQFYSIAADNSTNAESALGSADASCAYDNSTPTSNVDPIAPPYWKKTSPLAISATASDASGGLKNVTLYYYNSTNNITWYGPWSFGVDTDPWISVSWSFTFPKGVGYYRFYSIAIDNATNTESPPVSNDTLCGYDNVAPISSVNAIDPYWKKAAATITATATDATSGVKNVTLWYRFSNDNNSWGGWVSSTTDTALPWSWNFAFSNGSGYYQFYSIAVDNATNTEIAPGGNGDANCGYDNVAPTSSVNAISPYWKMSTPTTITATASDALSGVKNVTLYYRFSTNNVTWGAGWTNAGTDSASPWSWSFAFSNGTGYYQFYSIATDNATNSEATPGIADAKCGYDITAPSSNINAITPYWKNAAATITATASDATSGVKNVTLWYQFSTDNSSWGGWVSSTTDTALPWSWSFSFTNGTGYYQFYSIAKDNATNAESAPGSADAKCGYDNVAPTSSVNPISPYINTTGTVELTATASDALSGVKNVTLWYRYSTDNSSWDAWTQNITDTDYNWNWTFTSPNGTGYYEFYSIAYDNATNNESALGTADARFRYLPNQPPVVSNPDPTDAETGVSVTKVNVSVLISDPDGDLMNWTIEVNNSNSDSGNNAGNGTIDCTLSIPLANSCTYTWWVNVTDGISWTNVTYIFITIGANKEIISKGRNAYSFEISPGGTTLYGYVNGNSVQTSIDTNWHYVTLTYDGSQLKIYKDGEFKANTSMTGSINTNANNLLLGRYLTGTLDEVRISSKARSAEWINTTNKMTDSPTSFIKVESEQNQQHTYLNITIENTGSTTIKTQDCTLLINGTKTSFVCIQTCFYPLKETNIFANVTAVGSKRNKFITGNGIIDYEGYG